MFVDTVSTKILPLWDEIPAGARQRHRKIERPRTNAQKQANRKSFQRHRAVPTYRAGHERPIGRRRRFHQSQVSWPAIGAHDLQRSQRHLAQDRRPKEVAQRCGNFARARDPGSKDSRHHSNGRRRSSATHLFRDLRFFSSMARIEQQIAIQLPAGPGLRRADLVDPHGAEFYHDEINRVSATTTPRFERMAEMSGKLAAREKPSEILGRRRAGFRNFGVQNNATSFHRQVWHEAGYIVIR